MEAKDYSIMYCKNGNLYINNSRLSVFRSKDSKRFSKEDLESIERWIEQNNEYVRKDSFIEKLFKWLEENVERHISADGEYTVYYEEMFEEFKKYMKGK